MVSSCRSSLLPRLSLEAADLLCDPRDIYNRGMSRQRPLVLLAKRLIVLLPIEQRERLGKAWIRRVGDYATLAWHGGDATPAKPADLGDHEYVVPALLSAAQSTERSESPRTAIRGLFRAVQSYSPRRTWHDERGYLPP